jgi:hypothetical protein
MPTPPAQNGIAITASQNAYPADSGFGRDWEYARGFRADHVEREENRLDERSRESSRNGTPLSGRIEAVSVIVDLRSCILSWASFGVRQGPVLSMEKAERDSLLNTPYAGRPAARQSRMFDIAQTPHGYPLICAHERKYN